MFSHLSLLAGITLLFAGRALSQGCKQNNFLFLREAIKNDGQHDCFH